VVAKAWLLLGLRLSDDSNEAADQALSIARSLSDFDAEHALVIFQQAAELAVAAGDRARGARLWDEAAAVSGRYHGTDHPRYFQTLTQRARSLGPLNSSRSASHEAP
jgi:hypothetical protein